MSVHRCMYFEFQAFHVYLEILPWLLSNKMSCYSSFPRSIRNVYRKAAMMQAEEMARMFTLKYRDRINITDTLKRVPLTNEWGLSTTWKTGAVEPMMRHRHSRITTPVTHSMKCLASRARHCCCNMQSRNYTTQERDI